MEIVDAKLVETKQECVHCGTPCETETIHSEGHAFCCEGCKMVYEILQENGLCNFYNLEEKAGISLKGKSSKSYAFLDDPDIQETFIEFENDQTIKISLQLPQIHCASCIWLLENLYRLNEGVLNSRVNFLKKEIYITFDKEKISLRQLVELLDSLGYTPEINLSQTDKTERKIVSKKLYFQLGVAGFAFGNIMLLSFPEYFGLEKEEVGHWFAYLNWILALPVLLFSGQDYLRSAWWSLRQQKLNIDVPIALGMLSLFGRSSFEIFTQTGAGYMDSLAGLIFFLLIGKWFQQKTYHRLSFDRDYKSYFPIATSVKNGKLWQSVPLQKIEVGQIIRINHQELIPTDGVLTKGQAYIDYAFVSGESEPIRKKIGQKIYAGGKQMGAAIELRVSKVVAQSYLTQLWNDYTFKNDTPDTGSHLADKVGQYFTFIILGLAFITLFYWLPIDVGKAINAFTAVLIIACPCALALAVPFTYGNVLRVLGRHQFYLKNTRVIEAIQGIQQLVFDKTGTLTDLANQKVEYAGEELNEDQKVGLKSLAGQSNHPKSRALANYFQQYPSAEVKEVKEVPGLGIQGWVEGQHIKIGAAPFMSSPQKGKGVFVELNGLVLGHFLISHSFRNQLGDILSRLASRYKLALLSGDDNSSRRVLETLFSNWSQLLFRQSPQDKLEYTRQQQSKDEKVMMIGDGLNDAGALKQSEVGVVITENINNFTPACDAILAAEKFASLPLFLQLINQSKWIVFVAYILALCYNIIGLSYAVQGLLSPVIAAILMPLSSITIILFGVLGSSFLALKMGLLKKDDEYHPGA